MLKGTQSRWFAVSLFLICTTIIASSFSVYYYLLYNDAREQYEQTLSSLRSSTYEVDIMVKFNNGTRVWHNNTIIPIGWSLFNATVRITNGNLNYSLFLGAPFITSILGADAAGSQSWIWWSWNSTERDWQLGEVGASAFILKDGSTVAWYLADTSTWPPAKP
jgi:hypothetical protein